MTMIELQNFSAGYGSRRLMSGVSTCFGSGTVTALIGRNGSGKSTLLRALAGLNRDYGGVIKVCGTELSRMPASECARAVAYVSTERIRIANMKCSDVVALGRAPYTGWTGSMSDRDRDIVRQAMEKTGMAAYAGRTMDKMSDGECQRVMIARALAQDTPVILLDEPTSFLDMPNRYELVSLLRSLAHREDKCILFSTHELDIAMQMCDHIALVADNTLYNENVSDMVSAGHIRRLFQTDSLAFDADKMRFITL